mgnify:CR=1 FL=1
MKKNDAPASPDSAATSLPHLASLGHLIDLIEDKRFQAKTLYPSSLRGFRLSAKRCYINNKLTEPQIKIRSEDLLKMPCKSIEWKYK